ncbi:hypothetical protein C8R42DRAFT_689012 [Lentinula raphanica]|nr:hypothetical protein C8R42DRAFT_689012 [Lentinula raphanica]
MEHTKNPQVCEDSKVYWLRLGLGSQTCFSTSREGRKDFVSVNGLVETKCHVLSIGSVKFTWEACSCVKHLQADPSLPQIDFRVCQLLLLCPRQACPSRFSIQGPLVDPVHSTDFAKQYPNQAIRPSGHSVVGGCEYVLWSWGSFRGVLCMLALCTGSRSRSQKGTRHWLGRSCSGRIGLEASGTSEASRERGLIQGKTFRMHSLGGYSRFSAWFPNGKNTDLLAITRPSDEQIGTWMMRNSLPSAISIQQDHNGQLEMNPSPLRPRCPAGQRIFQWTGINTPPPSVIDNPVIRLLSNFASEHSLRDTKSYGAGLRKFHIFCDIFSVNEADRLPASFAVLHSFAIWAATNPETLPEGMAQGISFEPVAVGTVRSYLAGIRAWHFAQGWSDPLSESDHERINFSLRGLLNAFGPRKKPVRPPITTGMLWALKHSLNMNDPFDACIWAIATSAFWGMMRFGEVSFKSRSAFDSSRHLRRCDAIFGKDLDGVEYIRLDMREAKSARNGEIQNIFLTGGEDLSAIKALRNLAKVVPAGPTDPLFSWRDRMNEIRPMVKSRALERINGILAARGWGTAFGHSFRIGGASHYLAQKVDPEIVRLAGRWKSMAYETYIRAFEQIASRHLGPATCATISQPSSTRVG